MRIRLPLILGLLLLVPSLASSQTTPVEGLRDNSPRVHALTGARIVVSPGTVLENATLVIRNGIIESVGANVQPPRDARVWDMTGRTLYPGFIDSYSDLGMRTEASDASRGPVNPNPQFQAVDAASDFTRDDAGSAALRSQGFTVAMVAPQLGIFRGQTAAVTLGDGAIGDRIVRPGIAQSASLTRSFSLGGYPTSSMGVVSFIRQALHDAEWYGLAWTAYGANSAGLRRPETNSALASLGRAARGDQPILFEVRSEEELLRAHRFTTEFPISVWIRGSGHEYRLVDEIARAQVPLILPVAFPAKPRVNTPEEGLAVSLADLRHWHLAPENPGRLAGAGVSFALTSDGLRDKKEFLPNVRNAVARGLAADVALSALTTTPARYLGIQGTHGTLERGKVANVVVSEGDLFADGGTVRDVWVDGMRYEVSSTPEMDPRGRWRVVSAMAQGIQVELSLAGTPERLSGTFTAGGQEARLGSVSVSDGARRLQMSFPGGAFGMQGAVRLSATVSGEEMHGWSEMPDGSRQNWRADRVAGFVAPATTSEGSAGSAASSAGSPGMGGAAPAASAASSSNLRVSEVRPAMEYGRAGIPDRPEHIHVRNATVWTMGPQGKLENADLLIRRGAVVQVGTNLTAPSGAVVIDATGKHVTPGLIDAHIHSGLSGGVNETGSAIVPEVRVGDVLTIDNIWMYRQLAGGLTTAHVMHGSANPIGGQNQHVKLRWGALPEELKFAGAPSTVKFALGENPVRRSGRYPDTRMGTEQIIRDHFKAAREYERAWATWERSNKRGIPPRVDLRLQAVVDILNEDILVQSHSYRQDEILMLMRLAEEFDFTIKAFHHGVEAYKVAPELARHGAGAVVWSDWSSFKIEAYDATTWNVRVLMDAGVLTSLHSDNSQLATRMHWEAAKMLRNGLTEEQALSLVTINTAKLLGIDDKVGSLEAGKDADFVIWNGSPLSTFTIAEQTWIDGRKYFDLREDRALGEETERERARIIQHILEQR